MRRGYRGLRKHRISNGAHNLPECPHRFPRSRRSETSSATPSSPPPSRPLTAPRNRIFHRRHPNERIHPVTPNGIRRQCHSGKPRWLPRQHFASSRIVPMYLPAAIYADDLDNPICLQFRCDKRRASLSPRNFLEKKQDLIHMRAQSLSDLCNSCKSAFVVKKKTKSKIE